MGEPKLPFGVGQLDITDPPAGSPTGTLLRLLLPLNDKICRASREPPGGEPSAGLTPQCSSDHSIGRSDGRCVQRAGTYSTRADDSRLQGIPRSRLIIPIIYPQHDASSKDFPRLSAQAKLAECISVARVRPRTSKGITDLLLPQTSIR